MRFARLLANQEGQPTLCVNPANVVAVIALKRADGRSNEISVVLTTPEPIEVVGSVAEVVAALESATAQPVAAAVEVAPDAGAVVLRLLGVLTEAAEVGGWGYLDYEAFDAALGVERLADWEDTAEALRALAAKLRGGG